MYTLLRFLYAAPCVVSAVGSAKQILGGCMLQVAPGHDRRVQHSRFKILESLGSQPVVMIQRTRWGFLRDETALEQVLVLTTARKINKKRTEKLVGNLRSKGFEYHIDVVTGVNANHYDTEAQEMQQTTIPMSAKERKEWMDTNFGYGPIHHGKQPDAVPSSGALACSLGHRRMWELSQNVSVGKWTLILEDDAKPVHIRTLQQDLQNALQLGTAQGASEVFLDDRHCNTSGGLRGKVSGPSLDLYAVGSTAYAVTAEGARALLVEPFSYGADHWLNVPVRSGKIAAYCLDQPLFLHNYKHASTID